VIIAACAVVLLIVGGAFSIGMAWARAPRRQSHRSTRQLVGGTAASSKAQIEDTRRILQEKVNALAMRVGQMNANVIRLDALGKRLTRMANSSDGEFDFGNPPAMGGGESGADGQPAQIPT
jgi:hypothetical protein